MLPAMMTTALLRAFPALAALVSTTLCLTLASPARATLLVHEGFTGYNAGTLAGQSPNQNTTGLGPAGYYDGATISRAGGYTLQAGLTFGSLATSGGALAYGTAINVIGADIDIGGTAFQGTLWSSYLVKFTATQASGDGDGALLRIGDSPNDTADLRYSSWADSRNSSTRIGTAYSGSTAINGDAALAVGTTYILISRFTRVGSVASSVSPATATVWALNETQFGNFIAAGGDEAALVGTSVTATATQQVTSGSKNFVTGDAISLVTVNSAGVFDEIRFGSTLADVTPLLAIPEPAAAAALSAFTALAFCAGVRRRVRR